MIARIIACSARNRGLVLLATGAALAAAVWSHPAHARSTPSPTSPTPR